MINQKSALGLDGNVTALLGYVIWVVALVLVFIEKDNKFVRFHAFQSLLFTAAIFVLFFVVGIVTAVVSFVSSTLGALVSLIFVLLWLALLGGIILLCVKAYQGQMFKLPVIGDMAEKWSN